MRESFRARSSSIEFLLTEVRSAFDPNSRAIQIWHQLLLAALIYEVTVLPYIATFKMRDKQWLIPEFIGIFVCELLFLADVYVELNMGYYEDGNVTMDAKKSRIKYLQSARFFFDIFALPPLSTLYPAIRKLAFAPIFLEFHKFLRVWRLPKYVAMLDDMYARHYVVLKMFKVLLVTLMLSHYVACFRFLFGYDDHHSDHWLPQAPDTKEEMLEHSPYLMSLFWAFGLLTGLFEGELPSTTVEFVFTIFVAMCGFSLFTYVCATFFMISKCESGHSATSEARINQLKHALSFHQVPESLQIQAIEYLKRYYTQSESNDREAVRLLCPSIAKDIQVELLKDMVGNILFFKDCDHQFIIAITSLLELISLPAHVVVFNAGEEGDAMYVVNSGVLHVIVKGIKIREVRKGAFFGEMALFLRRPRYATVVTSTYCTLYKLVRFHVERLFEGYPEYGSVVPKRVEEMARALFGRVSGEALIIPDEDMIQNDNDSIKTDEKRTFASLIRKHIKKDKGKVAPAGDSSPESPPTVAPSAMMLMAVQALRRSRPPSQQCPDTMKSNSEDRASADDHGTKSKAETVISTRPPTEAVLRPTLSGLTDQHRRSTTTSVTKALHEIYSQIGWSASGARKRYWWSRALLMTAIDNDSRRRLWWVGALQAILIYNWFLIPLQLAFVALQHSTWYIIVLNVTTDLALWADVYVNLNLSYLEDSEKIWDTTRTAIRYSKSWLLVDVLCVFPYWFFAQTAHHSIPRIPRLLRVIRLRGHFQEIDDYVKLTSKQRLVLFGVLLIVLYHMVACLYFSVTFLEGFSDAYDSWIPSGDVFLASVNDTFYVDSHGRVLYYDDPQVTKIGVKQYFRSLYYAANVLTALGRTIEPASDVQYGMALVFMLSGFFITAIVVDNVQKRFTASAVEQKEFFATRSHIQLFLRRQNAPLVIHKRVNSFLDYWWSSHRGAVISELLEELPETIKRDILQSICHPALQTLALLNGVRPVLSELENVFLGNVKFILYGQGEIVYRQGDYANGLFFLLSGEVCITANGGTPRSIHQGGFFGTAALHLEGNAVSYTDRVTATHGCMVLFVSREHIQAMKGAFASLEDSLRALERRFLDPKLAKASQWHIDSGGLTGGGGTGRLKLLRSLICCGDNDRVYDPDSWQMLAWETWLFMAMTIEWIFIMFHVCFGVAGDNEATTEAVMVLIEVHFVADMYIRSHLGYHEFGNKVMIPKQIRRRYFRSHEFVVDLIALIPLFFVNWGLSHDHRNEMLNINKLLRLSKVPAQFLALENKYLKRTLELRLFKLVYYTFLLSHMFGCVWFDFGSNTSGIHSLIHDVTGNGTASSGFGISPWMPPAILADANTSLQYFSSLFWSFALMSASSAWELPKTDSQCIFSVVTMTFGFFLFAYVIGNFSDTIELMDAENREFYAKLNSLRHFLSHFKLPAPIADKFKNYYFFKRFHSITQEHLLGRCLPPSLLTDIRMVHLQPMIVKVTFLSGMDASVTRMLVSQFNQELIVKDEFVYKFGEEGSDMFFVFTGVLSTLLPQEEFAREASMIERRSVAEMKRAHADDDDNQSNATAPRHDPSTAVRRMPSVLGRKQPPLTKINEISAGNYFGENALFFNSVRTSYVQANTSCILYSLSRYSLELVFERYPDWKQKVLRIVTINQEQQRLNMLAYEEEKNAAIMTMIAQVDQANARAEQTEEELLALWRMKSISGRRKGSQTGPEATSSIERIQAAGLTAAHTLCMPRWLSEFVNGTTAQSKYHLFWLQLITVATIYVAVIVPYRISFDSLLRTSWLPVMCRELELVCEFLFIGDIWFNWRLRGSNDSMELYEQDHRRSYKRERLKWDLLAAFPLDYLLYSLSPSPWYRINRVLKIRNVLHYMHEINRRNISNEMKRLRMACLMYILIIYWSACAYFVIAIYDRYGDQWNAWLPSAELKITHIENPSSQLLALRLLRGLFFATTAFVKKGRTFIPDSTSHYVFTITTCFIGLLIMAFMLGEIASLFISYIGNEVEYRKNHIAVELYLGRWKIQGDLKARTQSFLSSLWSSHRGVDYQSLLEEVPLSVRMESVLDIAHWPLKNFTDTIFRPLCRGSRGDIQQQAANVEPLMQALAQRLKFEGYPRDERVLVEGSIAKAMYFVVRGHLRAASRAHAALYSHTSYVKGDYFGESGLLGYSVSAFTVNTMRACDLLSLSAEDLLAVLHGHPTFSLALKIADTAAERVKQLPLASNTRTMEMRWGQQLIEVVNDERKVCDQSAPDVGSRRQLKKRRAVIDRLFVTCTPDECYVCFRSLLQIIVANGFIHLHGTPPIARSQSPTKQPSGSLEWARQETIQGDPYARAATNSGSIRVVPTFRQPSPESVASPSMAIPGETLFPGPGQGGMGEKRPSNLRGERVEPVPEHGKARMHARPDQLLSAGSSSTVDAELLARLAQTDGVEGGDVSARRGSSLSLRDDHRDDDTSEDARRANVGPRLQAVSPRTAPLARSVQSPTPALRSLSRRSIA